MKYIVILFSTILITSCGVVKTTQSALNNKNLSQVEKDIATCELGQDLYKKCTPYSGFRSYETYDNWDYGKSYKDNYKDGYFPMYSEEWIDECQSGETKVWLNLFGAKTYVRNQDIKECMNNKGYTYKNTVWLKSKPGFIYRNDKWVSFEEYLNIVKNITPAPDANTDKSIWTLKVYPEKNCSYKYNLKSDVYYRCVDGAMYYRSIGEFVQGFFYPKLIIKELSNFGFTLKDIDSATQPKGKKTIENKNTKTPVTQHLKETKKISKYSTNTHKENTERDQVASKKHNSIADINNLKKIKDLLDSGVINKQEFNTMKAKIIKGM
jgi:hypothetical protein